jgi:Protein of unknown function (DUF3037)
LPTPPVAVVDVGEDLIRVTPALLIELPRSRTPCRAGLQFGSSYPGNPRSLTLYDFLPDERLREVHNLHDFAGMLVFDKWTCNTKGAAVAYPLRDEWVNIGMLVFDERTGERRLRLIEDEEEFHRVRRLHPAADESLLRRLRDNLDSLVLAEGRVSDWSHGGGGEWLRQLGKLDGVLSSTIQVSDPQGTRAMDLDAEVDRLYTLHIAMPRAGRAGLPGSRGQLRASCSQVFKQARLWERLEKSVRAAEFTFPGDPMRLDYSYRRNGTRGFVQTLSVTRAPADAKLLAYTAKHIQEKAAFTPEFAAVTDVPLEAGNDRHRFVRDTLREVGVEPVALEGFAVWVAKLRPMLQ